MPVARHRNRRTKRQIKAEVQKVETVVPPLLTKLRDIEREYLESSKNPENSGKTISETMHLINIVT